MARCWRVLALLVVIGGVVPLVAGVDWTIEDVRMFPMNASNGSTMVVVANVSDDQNKPVNPDRCDAPGDDINVRYEYPFGADREQMSYITDSSSWFYNQSLTGMRNADTVTVYAGGTCNGVTSASVSQNVSFKPSGNLSVSLLTDVSGEHGAGETVTVEWNVTNASQLNGVDRAFEPYANLSWQLYTLTGEINRSGSVVGGQVGVESDRFTADIPLPPTGGLYILNANVSNRSMTIKHPYGGAAVPIRVISDLRGRTAVLPGNRCVAGGTVQCEKGGQVEVRFHEHIESAETVNVSVSGKGQTYTFFTLTRWNASMWNGTVRLSEDFNTSTYGHGLTVTVNASNNLDVFVDAVDLNLSRFTLLEETQQFADQGDTVTLVAGPVTPYSELPISRTNMSTVNFSVQNTSNMVVFNVTLTAPFDSSSYDDNKKMFATGYDLPITADTGQYMVTTAQTDVYGVTQWLSFPFTVLSSGETVDRPVALERVNGEETDELDVDFYVPGNVSIPFTLNNSVSVDAAVDVFISGDIADHVTVFEAEPVQLAGNTVTTLHLNTSLPAADAYTGTINVSVSGDEFAGYNITLPTTVTVGDACEQLNGSLCLIASKLAPSVTPGAQNLSVTAVTATDTTLQINASGAVATVLEDSIAPLRGREPATITLPFTVTDADIGDITGSLQLSIPGATVSAPVTITVAADDVDTASDDAFTVAPTQENLGTFTEGESVPVEITVTNTGSTTIQTLDLSISTLGMYRTASVNLAPGDETTLDYTTSAPDLGGETSVSVRVESGGGTVKTTTVQLTAYGNFTREFQQLVGDIERLRTDLGGRTGEKAAIRNNLTRMEDLLEAGQTAAERGDYATASSRFEEVAEIGDAVNAAILDLPQREQETGGGLPVVPIVVLLVILLVIGVILYLSLVPEDEGEPDFSRPPPQSQPRF